MDNNLENKNSVYDKIMETHKRQPGGIRWRVKAHASVIENHLNPGEEVLFAFAAQKGLSSLEIFNTYAIAVTNKRIILAQKRVLFGYLFLSITPDMFNDLTVNTGIIWGRVVVDTVKEVITLSNLSKKLVDDIETAITEVMMSEKKKYVHIEK